MRGRAPDGPHDLGEEIDKAVALDGLSPLVEPGDGRFKNRLILMHKEGGGKVYKAAYAVRWHCWLYVFDKEAGVNCFHADQVYLQAGQAPLVTFNMGLAGGFEVEILEVLEQRVRERNGTQGRADRSPRSRTPTTA